jgi:hypothetical protein
MTTTTEHASFIRYIDLFYGDGPDSLRVIDPPMTRAEAEAATMSLEASLRARGETPAYDSVDREFVRDIVLSQRAQKETP